MPSVHVWITVSAILGIIVAILLHLNSELRDRVKQWESEPPKPMPEPMLYEVLTPRGTDLIYATQVHFDRGALVVLNGTARSYYAEGHWTAIQQAKPTQPPPAPSGQVGRNMQSKSK